MKRLSIILLVFFQAFVVGAQTPNLTFENPILPGFYPDPSICRVGENYYMVNSSFEWYPGLPLHQSTDLVNWNPIGHAISRLNMLGDNFNLWAPTIRYHNGLFYVICTELPGRIFFVTASDPQGEWSDPIYFDVDEKAVSPIDPSLFWDTDGTCWLASNDRVKSGNIKHWIWIQKVDLTPVRQNNRLEASFIGERKYITKGSGVGPDDYCEGPHIYKYRDWYYLMISEGGTWANHAISFLRTKSLESPVDEWEYHPLNPVLTHRDKESIISATGHADMVETQNGEWWAVHLGVRKQEDKHKLGRETFLVPVKWKQDSVGALWPYFNPDHNNMTLETDQRPNLPWNPICNRTETDEFDDEVLRPEWNFYTEPKNMDWYELKDGKLKLKLLKAKATDKGHCAFIARRQQHHNFNFLVEMKFTPKNENEVAGIMASIKNTNNIRLEISRKGAISLASVWYVSKNGENKTAEVELPNTTNKYCIKLEARGWNFQFFAGSSEDDLVPIGEVQDAKVLSSEVAKGFTGSYIGMYASSNNILSESWVDYNWVKYLPQIK